MTRAGLVVLAVSLAWLLVGCNRTFCNGVISCGRFDLEKCSTVAGCTPGPACEIRTIHPVPCATATDQASCAAPMCSWVENACVPFCRTLATETVCNAHNSTEKEPDGSALWGCVWVQCFGKPDKPSCGQYSVEMCPGDLGCRVETSNGFPDN